MDKAKIAALKARGADVVVMPNSAGKVELPDLFRELARREVNEVHVEAGHRLNGSLMREGFVDELLIYLAAGILGDKARGMFGLPDIAELSGRRELAVRDVRMIGPDIRVIARTGGSWLSVVIGLAMGAWGRASVRSPQPVREPAKMVRAESQCTIDIFIENSLLRESGFPF